MGPHHRVQSSPESMRQGSYKQHSILQPAVLPVFSAFDSATSYIPSKPHMPVVTPARTGQQDASHTIGGGSSPKLNGLSQIIRSVPPLEVTPCVSRHLQWLKL
jgi:hypothetical protein